MMIKLSRLKFTIFFLPCISALGQVTWEFEIDHKKDQEFDLIIKGKIKDGTKILGVKEKKCPLGVETQQLRNLILLEGSQEIVEAKESELGSNLVYEKEIKLKQGFNIQDPAKTSTLQLKFYACQEMYDGSFIRAFGVEKCYILKLGKKYKTISIGGDWNFEDCEVIYITK